MNVLVERNIKQRRSANFKELEKKNGRSKKGKEEEHNELQAETEMLQNGILTYEDKISSLNTTTIAKQLSELKEMHDNCIVEVTCEEDTHPPSHV